MGKKVIEMIIKLFVLIVILILALIQFPVFVLKELLSILNEYCNSAISYLCDIGNK